MSFSSGKLDNNAAQSQGHGPTVSALPGKLFKMHILRPDPRPAKLETLRVQAQRSLL